MSRVARADGESLLGEWSGVACDAGGEGDQSEGAWGEREAAGDSPGLCGDSWGVCTAAGLGVLAREAGGSVALRGSRLACTGEAGRGSAGWFWGLSHQAGPGRWEGMASGGDSTAACAARWSLPLKRDRGADADSPSAVTATASVEGLPGCAVRQGVAPLIWRARASVSPAGGAGEAVGGQLCWRGEAEGARGLQEAGPQVVGTGDLVSAPAVQGEPGEPTPL